MYSGAHVLTIPPQAESRRSNMYGAVPHLMSPFGLDRQTAFGIVCRRLDRQVPTEEPTAPDNLATRRTI
jgi:hypothetical protein